MITLRVWFVMIAVVTVLAGRSVWTSIIVPGTTSSSSASATVTDGQAESAADAEDPRLDIYGNEIEDAVGDYRVDVLGDVYERHSPDTEVPRLAAPVI